MKKSHFKKLAVGVVGLLLLVIVLVLLVPTLISAGLGHGMIRNAIQGNLAQGSRVEFQTLSVTWRGPQAIRGLRIFDPDAQEVVNMSFNVDRGLWALMTGAAVVLEIESAVIQGTLYEDGSTSIEKLVATDPTPKPASEHPRPFAAVPEATLRILSLDLALTHAVTGERLALNDFAGELKYTPHRSNQPSDISFDFAAQTLANDVQGDVKLTGSTTGLVDGTGAISPSGAPVNFELAVNSIPVLGMDVPTQLASLVMLVAAEDLAESVTLEATGETTTQGEPPSRFRAEATVRAPLTPEGKADFRMENIEATLSGERVPSAIIQPFLARTPIVLQRDVGRSVEFDLQIQPGAGRATGHVIGEKAQLEIDATFDADTKWLRGSKLNLVASAADPALMQGFGVNVDRPVNLAINLTSFAIPPIDDATDKRPLAQMGAAGTVNINSPVGLILNTGDGDGAPPRSILLESGQIVFDSQSLGQGVNVNGSLRVEGGEVRLQERITNLINAQGEIDAMAAHVVGELIAENIPSRMITQFMPEQDELMQELLGDRIGANLTTAMSGPNLQATLTARGSSLETNLVALRKPDSIEVSQTWANVTVNPRVASLLQKESESPIILAHAASARFELDPFVLQGSTPNDLRLSNRTIRGRVSMNNVAVDNLPGLKEQALVRDLNAAFAATLSRDPLAGPGNTDDPLLESLGMNGGVALRRGANDAPVAIASFEVNAKPKTGGPELSGEVALREINPRNLELIMGREPGMLELWAGETGTVTAQFSGADGRYDGTLVSDMPRLQGTITATLADDIATLRTTQTSLNLGAQALANLMGGEQAKTRVERDVPLTMSLNATIPLAFIREEAMSDPTKLNVHADMRGGPLVMLVENERTTLENVQMLMTLRGYADAVEATFSMSDIGDTTAATVPTSMIKVDGSVRERITPGEPVSMKRGVVNLNVALNRAPIAPVDAIFGMSGNLIALVGHHASGSIVAKELDLSGVTEGGTMNVDLESANGWLRGGGISRAGGLSISTEEPLEAELEITPLLRDNVLAKIHPIFADLLAAENPMKASFGNALVPFDGNVNKLSGHANLAIGEISLDKNSRTFAILAIPGVTDVAGSLLNAHVEPIAIRIKEGVIDYDRFMVRMGVVNMAYSGNINLNTRQVRLRTAVPLTALSLPALGVRTDQLLPGVTDLEVPLVQRGELGQKLRMEVDPEFDLAGKLIRGGIERGLRDLLGPRN